MRSYFELALKNTYTVFSILRTLLATWWVTSGLTSKLTSFDLHSYSFNPVLDIPQLSFLALVMQIVHHFYIERLLQKKKQTDQYISLDWASFIGTVDTYINGIAIFLIWIRLLSFLVINRTMTVFKKVLLRVRESNKKPKSGIS